MDELRSQRLRRSERVDRLDRTPSDGPERKQVLVGRVFNAGALPGSTLRYFAVRPFSPSGAEAEGTSAGQDISSNAQELVLVLGPKVPQVGDDLIAYAIGDRWVAGQAGGGGCPGSPSLSITVQGCFGLRLPGATVTCNGATKVTDGQGVATFPVTSAGTYAGTIGRDRFVSQNFSLNLNCASGSFSRTLVAAPGFYCFCNCSLPLPATLSVADPVYGPATLRWSDSVQTWTASRVVTAPGRLKEPPTGGEFYQGCSTDADVYVPIVYQVGCVQGRQPLLNVLFSECQRSYPITEQSHLTNAPDSVDFAGWPLSPSGSSGSTIHYTCSPLDYSINIAFEGNGLLLYPAGPLTFTVRE